MDGRFVRHAIAVCVGKQHQLPKPLYTLLAKKTRFPEERIPFTAIVYMPHIDHFLKPDVLQVLKVGRVGEFRGVNKSFIRDKPTGIKERPDAVALEKGVDALCYHIAYVLKGLAFLQPVEDLWVN